MTESSDSSGSGNPTHDRRIAIVGTGFSGLCLAIHLKKIGVHSFTLFEKADRIGGTWRDNTYPGAECDIPSALYSFSFERNPRWTHKWSEQAEILQYLEHCATKHDLYPHIRFGCEVMAATFDEETGDWCLKINDVSSNGNAGASRETNSGNAAQAAGGSSNENAGASRETNGGNAAQAAERFDVFVSGVGQLHKPSTPAIEGAGDFSGATFHSARWDHGFDPKDKRVAVIGNAASAVQFIPQIAPVAEHVTVFQRSANWIIPKHDREYTAFEKWFGTVFPPFTNLYRLWIWLRGEGMVFPLMNGSGPTWYRTKAQNDTIKYIEEKIRDPELRKTLVPDYPMGARRILFSDDYYDALDRDNVQIVTTPIARITERGVQTDDGVLHEADAIIYATGFESTSFLTPMRVVGRGGEVLNETWERDGAEAYLGITHTGFPNFFLMYGPNTNLGHNSIVIMIEAQTRYILSCLDQLSAMRARWLDVKRDVQRDYNDRLQERMHATIWNAVDKSWYKKNGKITNNWVGRTTEYRRLTRRMNPRDYEFAAGGAADRTAT